MAKQGAQVVGLAELTARFKDFGSEGVRLVKAIVQSTGDEIAAEAKSLAPKDLGRIRQEIFKESLKGGYVAQVTANAPESAYQEFGTGARVSVPSAMTEEALKFKGKGDGTWEEFLKAMEDWIRRKGITATYSVKTRKRSKAANSTSDAAEQFAYLFARAILKKGLKPQPFLYPAWLKYAPKLPDKLKAGLRKLLKSNLS